MKIIAIFFAKKNEWNKIEDIQVKKEGFEPNTEKYTYVSLGG